MRSCQLFLPNNVKELSGDILTTVLQGLTNIFFELLPNQIYGKLAHHLEFCLQSFLDTFGPQRPGFVGDGRAGLWALNTLCKIE